MLHTAPERPATDPSAKDGPGPGAGSQAPAYELDLRATPLDRLSAEQRRRLAEEPQVRVTLSDGTVLTYRNASGMVLLDGDMAVSSSAQAAEYLRRVDAAGMSA